jgi:formylglycine-generating enzyme required for sulfatase activity
MEPRHVARVLIAPAAVLAGRLLLIAIAAGELQAPASGTAGVVATPATVVIAPRHFTYRDSGEYLRDGHPEDAPLVHVADPPALEIMTFEAGAADYALCVADGACRPAEPRRRGSGDVPVTGVSFEDANAYAGWLSARTGSKWRLPTMAEWVFAAGGDATDPALGVQNERAGPAGRWLALYEKEAAARDTDGAAVPRERGAFGLNAFGVADVDGPVWEWTSTCTSRTTRDAAGAETSRVLSCGVRVLEGRHRTAMSYFVRDGRSGGCSIGAPPDNLGFRLVREAGWIERLRTFLLPPSRSILLSSAAQLLLRGEIHVL